MSDQPVRPGETCNRPKVVAGVRTLVELRSLCGKPAVVAVELEVWGETARIALCQDCYHPAFWALKTSKPG